MERHRFQELLSNENLYPAAAPTQKIKLLAKGDNAIMVTLYLTHGEQKAFCSLFIGLLFKWEIETGCLTLKSAIDSAEIEITFECYDLEEFA